MLPLKPRHFVQSSFDMQTPRKPHVFLSIFSFVGFGDVAFSEYFLFLFFLYGEYAVRSLLRNGVFLRCDHGFDFIHQLM